MTESTLEGYSQLYELYESFKYSQPRLNSNFTEMDFKQKQSGYSIANDKLIRKDFENSPKIQTNLEEHLNKTNPPIAQHQYLLKKIQDKEDKSAEPFIQNNEENKYYSVLGKKNGLQIFEEENKQTNINFWSDEFIKRIYHKLQVILKIQRENWEEQKACGDLLDDILSFMYQSDDLNFQHLLKSLRTGFKTLKSLRKSGIIMSTKHKEDFSDDDEILSVPNNRSPKPFPEEKLDTVRVSTNGDISNIEKKSAPYKKLKSELDQVQLTSSSNLEKKNTLFGYVSSGVKNLLEIMIPTNNETSKESCSRRSTGLRNLGQTCYMNALFQCLYQIKPFRQTFYRNQTSIHCSLDESLASLFFKIEKNSFYWEVDGELRKLVKLIYQTRKEFQSGKSGDSCALFRAILEELSIGSSLEQSPYSKMFFGGPLIKTLVCQACSNTKKIQETMQIFQVQDIHFSKDKEESFFKSLTEKRFCPCNQRQNIFGCSSSATSLPEVLAIKIHDTVDSSTHVQALKRLSLKQSPSSGEQEKMIEYELIASVLNFHKGENGFHSIALVREEEEKYYVYDDNYLCGEAYSRNYHPQLLFYTRAAVI